MKYFLLVCFLISFRSYQFLLSFQVEGMTEVFRSLFWKLFRATFNLFGLSSFKTKRDEIVVSKISAIKNLLLLVPILSFGIYRRFFIDLGIFLRNADGFSRYTGFSVSIFRIISEIPLLLASYIILTHFGKRYEILRFIKTLFKFNERFNVFAEFGKENSRYLLVTLGCLGISKILQFILMFKPNFWVITSYSVRMFCEWSISLFILAFSMFIKFATFLVGKLNVELEECNGRRATAMEKPLNYFQGIEKIMNDFFSLFHSQIGFIIFFMTFNGILMVRNNRSFSSFIKTII